MGDVCCTPADTGQRKDTSRATPFGYSDTPYQAHDTYDSPDMDESPAKQVRRGTNTGSTTDDKEDVSPYKATDGNPSDLKESDAYDPPILLMDRCVPDGYVGESVQGKRHGRGVFVYPDGARYEGMWENDRANGEGSLIHSDGDVYTGSFVNDKAHGHGTFRHSNGARYSG